MRKACACASYHSLSQPPRLRALPSVEFEQRRCCCRWRRRARWAKGSAKRCQYLRQRGAAASRGPRGTAELLNLLLELRYSLRQRRRSRGVVPPLLVRTPLGRYVRFFSTLAICRQLRHRLARAVGLLLQQKDVAPQLRHALVCVGRKPFKLRLEALATVRAWAGASVRRAHSAARPFHRGGTHGHRAAALAGGGGLVHGRQERRGGAPPLPSGPAAPCALSRALCAAVMTGSAAARAFSRDLRWNTVPYI